MEYLNETFDGGRITSRAEMAVVEHFMKRGYDFLRRGWPDYAFFKGKELILVEVKQSKRFKPNRFQARMIKLLTDAGLDVRVAYGLKPDGTPDFQKG